MSDILFTIVLEIRRTLNNFVGIRHSINHLIKEQDKSNDMLAYLLLNGYEPREVTEE